MEKIETNIKYKTFKIMQMSRGKKLVEIRVPDGVVFHLSMGHVTGVDEDRDTYNFIAVIPYDESIYTFLLEQKCDYTVHNIFDTYISWIIKDSVPEDFTAFPFTTADPNIEPFYIKTLSVNREKKNKMYIDILTEIYNHDGEYPPREEARVIERRCIEESSIITGYMKITGISFFGVHVVHIRCVPTSTAVDSGIFRQYISYTEIFGDDNLIATKDEFATALNTILQDLDILDIL